MDSLDTVFRLQIFFSGRVQGVGFRYSTLQLAKGYEVTGSVKNLADGRVELEVEGEEGECRQFLEAIQDEMEAFIRKTETRESVGPKRSTQFVIA